MIAVDTNVIVRLLTHDDESQFQAANALFQQEELFISKTVVLEVGWVLRFAYDFAAADIVAALRRLFDRSLIRRAANLSSITVMRP